MNNIAEGFGRYSNKDFRRFLDIAAGSNLEVKSMLYLGHDLKYTSESKLDFLLQQNEKIHYQLLALIKYLGSKSN
jgi:four helix bundle protein